MREIPKLLGYSLVMSFFAMILLTSIFTFQVQLVYAGGKSPYESGYDHGCDDAGISDPSDRYINQPEKGPSFHTDAFMRGYNAGFNACSGGDSIPSPRSPGGGGGINWMQTCRQLDAIIIPSCSSLVYSNNVLTVEGERVKGCIQNGLALAGGGAFLLNLPIEAIIPILRALSEPTGCGGIIEWNFIGNVGNLKGIIDILT